jgi:hypothetical protein
MLKYGTEWNRKMGEMEGKLSATIYGMKLPT